MAIAKGKPEQAEHDAHDALPRIAEIEAYLDLPDIVVRNAMGERDFDAAWAEGAAFPRGEAIAYAQRCRCERKRPSTGWASRTPAEREVVRRVREGLANKGVGTRLFI